jgi:chaperone required for assembly of F1-ATPase
MTETADPNDLAKLARPPLPKRFYKAATAAPEGNLHVIKLDERPVRTPKRALLAFADPALAEAVAGEWEAQKEVIDPAVMPLTRITNSAIDNVAERMAETAADIAAYAANDLLCYRAESPEGLAKRQGELWDPLLAWADEAFGTRLILGEGVVPVQQTEEATARLAEAVGGFEALPLAALHVATTLTGSAILALSVAHGRLSAEEAWTAAHVDEDWQIAQWGEVAEAKARREARWREMEAAAFILGRS